MSKNMIRLMSSLGLLKRNLFYSLIAFIAVILSFSEAKGHSAAAHKISGIVSGSDGPLEGVSVKVKGSRQASITNVKGFYEIVAEEGEIIVFTCIGYKPLEVAVAAKSMINVSLVPDVSGLNQVVVVAYGRLKKKDLTGSVSSIDAQSIQDIPFTTVDNAVAGKAAGVQVTKSDGSPGGSVRVRIRGSSSLLGGNDPLYVIDGVPVQVSSNFISPGYDVSSPVGNNVTASGGVSAGLSTSFVNGLNSLGGLNPDDIESITILKDASSTAIYGSKAANGVVIITTKQGRRDQSPQINASYYTTVSAPKTPKVLNASEYRLLMTEAARNDYDARTANGSAIPAVVNTLLNNPSAFFGNASTNWIEQVTRTTVSHNAELSLQGGSAKSRYFSSLSYNNTPGVVAATAFQRISGKLDLENNISDKFRFSSNFIMGYTNQDIGDGAYGQALSARPDYAVRDVNGNFTDFSAVGAAYQGYLNPAALLTATNNASTFSLLGSVSVSYEILPGLSFKSMASLNMQAYNQRNYTPSYVQIGSFYGNVANTGGIGGNSNSRLANWFFENTLSYNKSFNGGHKLDLLAGTSYETKKTSFFSATATGYPNDNLLNNLSSAVTPLYVRGDDPSKPQSYLLSFYIRANYAYLDKYLFTITGRTDGSSKFGPNNKFGYFPSGAVAWRASQESFLKNVSWISDLKIRSSYGVTGNQNIGDQMYRTLYTPYAYNGSSALIPTQLGNQAIKWETTKEFDAGSDLSLFRDRLQLVFDYYDKRTNGALLALPIAPGSAYSTLLSNAVNIKNSGFEFTIQGDIIKSPDFKWSASFNISFNRSLVTKLNANADLTQLGNLTGLDYGNTTLIQGKPLGLITGYTVTGIIKNQDQLAAYKQQLGAYARVYFPYLGIGDPMYKLVTSNVTNNAIDSKSIIAEAATKYYGGFSQGVTYKRFDLQLFFTYSQGGKLLWGDHISSVQFVGTANANAVMLDRFNPANTGSNMPRLLFGSDANYYKSSLDVFSSSYVKLRSVSFTYHLNKGAWMERSGLKNAQLFASATNLFTFTKYPGNDPETAEDPYSVNGGYLDVSNYPTVRTFSLGLKAGF
ncbi:SusC/RagA family TonB-linked outer membrane protein [Mucilaginibacter rubeus]|uniref:TonB-dependent receptor n=1 Tax=Mucilaginibacter rubeus TaxID=2027860 RepID=A0A5C1I2Y9_9SPHI|nr:TonB-dependent receptor [Mucilaginibacter rubeus]QEM11758.1 TonB-dependent receptor [Mucilaginibacter rubeus]